MLLFIFFFVLSTKHTQQSYQIKTSRIEVPSGHHLTIHEFHSCLMYQLQGKLEGDVLSSPVQPLLLEGEQGHLIAGVYRLNPSMQGWRPDRGTECSSIMLDRDA